MLPESSGPALSRQLRTSAWLAQRLTGIYGEPESNGRRLGRRLPGLGVAGVAAGWSRLSGVAAGRSRLRGYALPGWRPGLVAAVGGGGREVAALGGGGRAFAAAAAVAGAPLVA